MTPHAIRLSAMLDFGEPTADVCMDAAAELRRLSSANNRLKKENWELKEQMLQVLQSSQRSDHE